MNFLKNVLGKKGEPIRSYDDFWNWFAKNERTFFDVVKSQKNIEKNFFDKLSPKLDELKDGFFYLTGLYDDDTVELVFTADGVIRNIIFVEELVASAPAIQGWKFTSLKPSLDIGDVGINMAGYSFGMDNLFFYSNDDKNYPDEIDITVVYDRFNEKDKSTIINGVYIFLDNYLGELNSVTMIDNLTVTGKKEAEKELVPMGKLKDFLIWREKEFVEKYEEIRYSTEKDKYACLEAELNNGKPLVATVDSSLLAWDGKASHPWILTIEIKYDGKNNNGMPDRNTSGLLDEIEDKVMDELKDSDGYLNVGRQTADSVREIYFACKDFRKPSKVLHKVQNSYAGKADIVYEIYKDKYWRSFNRFMVT